MPPLAFGPLCQHRAKQIYDALRPYGRFKLDEWFQQRKKEIIKSVAASPNLRGTQKSRTTVIRDLQALLEEPVNELLGFWFQNGKWNFLLYF